MRRVGANGWGWLLVGLGVVVGLRLSYQPHVELNPDSSAWISGAISAAQSNTPFWTLLTHSDSRPLTVLPLYLFEVMGIPVDWYVAGLVGLGLWLITVMVFFQLLRRWFPVWQALLGTLPLLIFLATTTETDFLDYNSEHVCVLMLTVGLWWVLAEGPRSQLVCGLLGVWLGLLPFAKLQCVPMGACLGVVALGWLWQHRAFGQAVWLVIGSLLPVGLVLATYTYHENSTAFWNDYFWNYYYYSFTTVYSNVPVESRFGLRYVLRLFFQHPDTRLFWGGSSLVLGAAMGWFFRMTRPRITPMPTRTYWVVLVFLAISFYATVQAGNLYPHYTMLIVVPLLLAVALFVQSLPTRPRWLLSALLCGLLVLEGIHNQRTRRLPAIPPNTAHLDSLIRQRIDHRIKQVQKLTIWGYADRFFVWSRLAAGNRLSHTFWAYWPSPLRTYRQQELLHDLTSNQTEWFLDFSQSGAMPDGKIDRPQRFPDLATYLRKRYTLVDSAGNVLFYKRNAPTSEPSESHHQAGSLRR